MGKVGTKLYNADGDNEYREHRAKLLEETRAKVAAAKKQPIQPTPADSAPTSSNPPTAE